MYFRIAYLRLSNQVVGPKVEVFYDDVGCLVIYPRSWQCSADDVVCMWVRRKKTSMYRSDLVESVPDSFIFLDREVTFLAIGLR